MPDGGPYLRLAEVHDLRFDVIAGQALKYAPIVTFLFHRFDNRKPHRRPRSEGSPAAVGNSLGGSKL